MSSSDHARRGRPAARAGALFRRPRFRPEARELEPRVLLSGLAVTPTPEEQYMLELINRARSNPPAEAQRLLAVAQTDPAVRAATQGTDLNAFAQVLENTAPLPPLAFDPRLIEAARNQDQVMLATNDQAHSPSGYLTNPKVATASDGQAYFPIGSGSWATGENVYAYTGNVAASSILDYINYLHDGLMIDWGNPDLGHLDNLMAPGPGESSTSAHLPYNEVGIGLLTNANPSVPPPANPSNPANRGLNVGPVLVSQEFAWRSGATYLTGVVYQDQNGDQFYEPGEGIGGATIQAVGLHGEGTFTTQTWGSGGYTLPLPPGTYTVSTVGGVPGPRSTIVTIGVDNAGWDAVYSAQPPTPDRPVAGDYDGDGQTDPAVYQPSTALWSIDTRTAGTRSFSFGQPGIDIPVPGDYDGDGKTDPAVYRPTTGQWFILGSRVGGVVLSFGQPGVDIPVPADFDGDGKADPAVYRPTTGQWFILGSKIGGVSLSLGQAGVDIPVPADFDGDGKADPAVYRPTTGQWFILQSSAGPRSVSFGAAGLDVPMPADYDGDGKADLAVYRSSTGQWFAQQSRNGPRAESFGAPGLDIPVAGDFDGDRKADLALFRPTTAQWLLDRSTRGPSALTFGAAGAPVSLAPLLSPTIANSGLQLNRPVGSPAARSAHGGPWRRSLGSLGSRGSRLSAISHQPSARKSSFPRSAWEGIFGRSAS